MLTRTAATLMFLMTLSLALVCWPAGPTIQGNVSPTATEPTATLTPEAPTAGDTTLLDAFLRARVAEYEATQSNEQGPSGQTTTPKTVSINISARSNDSCQAIMALLAEQGATNTRLYGSTQIYADIPASLLSALDARSDIDNMRATEFPYPNLDSGLNGLAVRYEAGLMPSEDVEPTYAMMSLFIDGDDNYDAVQRFLVAGGATMAFGDIITANAYKPLGMLVAYVPVKLFAELDSQPGIYDSKHEIYPVPTEMRRTEYSQDVPPSIRVR